VTRSEISKTETVNGELHSRMAVLKDEQLAVETDITRQRLLQGLGPLEEVKALVKKKDEWENAIADGVEVMRGRRRGSEDRGACNLRTTSTSWRDTRRS
jgi:hypothetical protein